MFQSAFQEKDSWKHTDNYQTLYQKSLISYALYHNLTYCIFHKLNGTSCILNQKNQM